MALAEDLLRVIREAGAAGLDPCAITKRLGLKTKPQGPLMALRAKGHIEWIPAHGQVKGKWVALPPKSCVTGSGDAG